MLSVKTVMIWVLGLSLLAGLFVLSRFNYLLFHCFAEFFSIAVAIALFIVVWNAREYINNRTLVFLGIAYLFVGGLDLVHTIAYKGMGVLDPDWGANPATQLWIAARFMESISLCLLPLLSLRRIRPYLTVAIYAALTALVLLAIFFWRIFPDCYIEGIGLTLFKKAGEYAICAVLVVALVLLSRHRQDFDPKVFRFLAAAILLTILGELAFTMYVSVYGYSNLLGHFFKIVSYYMIYLALVRSGLKIPYSLLFRNLAEEHERLEKSRQLFKSAVEYCPVPMLVTGGDDEHVSLMNNAFIRLFGYDQTDIQDIAAWWDKAYPDASYRARVQELWDRENEHVRPEQTAFQGIDVTVACKDGTRKEVFVQSAIVDQTHFIAFLDLTERKKAEQERERLITDLQQALDEIKTLKGILPICSHCKQIRDDQGYWNQVEAFVEKHSDAEFSHSICRECAQKYYPDLDLYEEEEGNW
ncbi:MAG: PAS domain S-box protein [Desulfohalobiaceae bacterium]|nr:PAS domain S-box protein [Desulfohalobiaceae bacterium]